MATGIALIPVARASDLEAESKKRSDSMQNQPVIQGLAAHVPHSMGQCSHRETNVGRPHAAVSAPA